MSAQAAIQPRTIARRARSGVFYGLTWSGIACVVIAIAVSFGMIRYGIASTIAVPIAAICATLGLVRASGRPLVEWTPIIGVYIYRALTKKTVFTRPLGKPRVSGTLGLPGDAARLRVIVDEHGTAFIHDPHTRHLTATLRVTHGGTVLLDPSKQAEFDRGWAKVMDSIARFDTDIAQVKVIERTLPSGGGLLQEYLANRSGELVNSEIGKVYESLVAKQGESLRHESLIAITLDLGKATTRIREMGGGMTGGVNLIREVMQTLQSSVSNAGLRAVSWHSEADLALLIRSVYDPETIPELSSATIGRKVETSGPMAVSETWNWVQTDSSYHQVFAVTEWPRSAIGLMSMWPLILTPGVHRTVSIAARPIPAGKSRREARVKVSDSRTEQHRRAKRLGWEDPEDRAEVAEAEKRLQEVTLHGSREFEFIGLVVVSAPNVDDLRRDARKMRTQAQAADVELRPLVAQQAQHLVTAALPVSRGL